MSGEEWRAVIGYEGLYEVSNLGRVRSFDRVVLHKGYGQQKRKGKMFNQPPDSDGYPMVFLQKEGKYRSFLTHVVVCTAFHGPKPSPKHEVRHIDGGRTNNQKDNLCWGTHGENMKDRTRHGIFMGENHPRAILCEHDIRDIIRLSAAGFTNVEIARRIKVKENDVSRVRLGKDWSWFTGIKYVPRL